MRHIVVPCLKPSRPPRGTGARSCMVGDSDRLYLIPSLGPSVQSSLVAQMIRPADILPLTEGCSQYRHPLVGHILVEHMAFSAVDNPELRVIVQLPLGRGEFDQQDA